MGRLIDADLLKECYAGTNSLDGKADYMSIRKMIDNQPTAYDVEAVVKGIIDVHNQTCTEEIDCKGWNCDECFEMRVRNVIQNGGRK